MFICLFVILLLCSPLDWLRRRGKKCLLGVSSEKGGGRERERGRVMYAVNGGMAMQTDVHMWRSRLDINVRTDTHTDQINY